MKNIFKYFMVVSSLIAFISCEDTTGDLSTITYFPDFVMVGESNMVIDLGTPYAEPGVTATEAGKNLEVIIEGEVDETKPGIYNITYSAKNSDGYPGSISREVVVSPPNGDFVTSIAGLYISNVQRAPDFVVTDKYSDLKYIFIIDQGNNAYSISCAIGGYYQIGRAYGAGYEASKGIITVNDIATNNFSFTQAEITGFGEAVDMSNMTVDVANKTISLTGTAGFANGEFHVQLKQVN